MIQTKPTAAQLSNFAVDALDMFDSVTEQSTSQLQSAPASQDGNHSQQLGIDSKFKVGIDNSNRNTINLCISDCLPSEAQNIQLQSIPNPTHLPIHFERM